MIDPIYTLSSLHRAAATTALQHLSCTGKLAVSCTCGPGGYHSQQQACGCTAVSGQGSALLHAQAAACSTRHW